MEEEIRQRIQAQHLFQDVEAVIIGASGGPDSMALLHLLARLRHNFAVTVIAVYVDHGLRPEEAAAEAALVREQAQKLGVEYQCMAVDTEALAQTEHLSIEDAARRLRYAGLRRIKHENDAFRQDRTVIALGHTEDDQAENILLRLLRGAGRRGLSGMRFRSRDLIRPLLATSKKQLLSWLAAEKIPFCMDSSNDEDIFLRNRVRQELLPLLEQRFDPGIRSALIKTAAILAEEETLLVSLTEAALEEVFLKEESAQDDTVFRQRCVLDRQGFRQQPAALQRRIIESLFHRLGAVAGFKHIMAVVAAVKSGRTGSEIHLPRGLRLCIKREKALLLYPRGRCSWRGSMASFARQER